MTDHLLPNSKSTDSKGSIGERLGRFTTTIPAGAVSEKGLATREKQCNNRHSLPNYLFLTYLYYRKQRNYKTLPGSGV